MPNAGLCRFSSYFLGLLCSRLFVSFGRGGIICDDLSYLIE